MPHTLARAGKMSDHAQVGAGCTRPAPRQTSNHCAIATQMLEARRAPHFNIPNVRKPMVKGMPMLPLNTRQETVPTCAEASILMNITRREWCQRCWCHRNRKPMNNQLPANASTATWENVRRTITSHLTSLQDRRFACNNLENRMNSHIPQDTPQA